MPQSRLARVDGGSHKGGMRLVAMLTRNSTTQHGFVVGWKVSRNDKSHHRITTEVTLQTLTVDQTKYIGTCVLYMTI
jgi:hypothetical protein